MVFLLYCTLSPRLLGESVYEMNPMYICFLLIKKYIVPGFPAASILTVPTKRYPRYIPRYGWLRSNQFLQSLWGKRSNIKTPIKDTDKQNSMSPGPRVIKNLPPLAWPSQKTESFQVNPRDLKNSMLNTLLS